MMDKKYNLIFHHTGCLTHSLETSKATYAALGFAHGPETYIINSQKVKVCFVELSPDVFIELVEPFEDNDTLNNYLKNKTTFYHLGFLSTTFEETLQQLQQDGFYLVNRFNSAAFNNKPCAFLYSPEMHLVEIIEG